MLGISQPFRWRVWPTLCLFISSLARRISSLLPLLGQPAAAAPDDVSHSEFTLFSKPAKRKKEVLSLDLLENDYLYRIKRNTRIVYVSVLDGDIVPLDCRSDSFRILSKLRKVPRWEEEWKTLTVRSGSHGIESTPDEFSPHGLDLGRLNVSSAMFYNLSDLRTVSRISDRISRVSCDGETRILKIAQFKYEIPYLQQEVSVYSTLTSAGFPLAPRFIGYVYEETKDRTVGFLMEEIFGNPPDIQNLSECVKTVRLLHTFGIVHGDPNRYNFLMTENGAKVFDFEVSVAKEDVGPAAAQEEIESLEAKLKDESGIGKR